MGLQRSYLLIITTLASLSVIKSPGAFAGAQSTDAGKFHSPTPANNFREARGVLLRESRVPPRIPTFLPFLDDNLPLYATIRSVDQSGYELDLEYQRDCAGSYACTYARLRGSSAPIPIDQGDINIAVVLRGGIQGHYIANKCGANCGEPVLKWSEGGFYYTIAMKAEDKETLIKDANSAITSGQTLKQPANRHSQKTSSIFHNTEPALRRESRVQLRRVARA